MEESYLITWVPGFCEPELWTLRLSQILDQTDAAFRFEGKIFSRIDPEIISLSWWICGIYHSSHMAFHGVPSFSWKFQLLAS